MKNKITKILICAILLTVPLCQSGFCASSVENDLNRIENELWGFSYDEQDTARLERIEKQIFGTTNSKLTPDKRVAKIISSLGLETYQEATSSLSELYVPEAGDESVQYPQIDRLESALLGNVYKNDNIYTRLERLEKKVFGAKQEGDLAQRTDALNAHASFNVASSQNQEYKQSYKNSYYDESDLKLQLSAIENMVFSTSFSNEPVPIRLSRLENRIFQRNFSDDDEQTRVARIQAAATAGKTAKYYDNNKFQKFASTGIQAASLLLMILAFIL